MSIQFGTATAATSTAAASFTADSSKSAVSITVNQGDSLATIAQSINNSGAGLSAYVSSNADGTAQLVLKGPTGADNAFTITASENSADPGLSALNWNPASTSSTMSSAQGAQDASYKLDGISHTSASNTIANAAPGLSLSLTGTNAGAPTTITYSDPSSAITTAMTNLTSTLNQIITTMNGYMTPSTSGSLANDPGAMALQTALTQLPGETIMPNATGTAPATLADLGLTLAKDGSLTLDTTKLSSILTSNPSGVAAMFTTGLNGIYGTLFNISSAVSSSTDPGSLEGSITYYTAQQTTLQSQQTAIATQQASLRTQLLSQLTNADTAVATSNSTLTFLKNQIAAWNKTSN
ncbi:MAG TPA: flagellar filament capping protein FliD [Novosphingobium sp.]|nr:flagellar filament capping protein FliD [Novosphingobium sp.]